MRRAAALAFAALAALAAVAAARADEVRVRTEARTYPVSEGRHRSHIAPDHAAKLRGKSSYKTDAVILENRYLALTVLPELGGRLVRAVYRPTGEDLFWVNDRITDGVSWSMGGGRWSFPFWEHGRHFDETGGCAVVRHACGGVTVAVDMRFEEFLEPAETRRYGRATCLRLVQTLRLDPDEARFTWTGRVTNPLPIRCGFKLWYLLRQPAVDGLEIILPTAAVTGHGSRDLKPWDRRTRVHGLSTSVFAVGMRHDFAGWYFPERDLNVLRIQDRTTAPGAKMVLYPPSKRGYVEMWGGNHEVFEECGRILPPFGAWEMAVTVLAARGLGRASFANREAAVSLGAGRGRRIVEVVPARHLEDARLEVTWKGGRRAETGDVGPDRPFKPVPVPADGAVRVRLRTAEAGTLLDRTLPIERGPMPREHFRGVQARTNMTLSGGRGLYAEATDLVSEHQLSLPKAAKINREILETSEDVRRLVDAARRLMRVRKNDPAVPAGLEKALEKEPKNPWANLYKAMWLIEADRPHHETVEPLQHAARLPGGRYLLALLHIRQGRLDEAVRLLESMLQMEPSEACAAKGDPALALLQPGATVANIQPRLLLAVLDRMSGREDRARRRLEALVRGDPALIEAWMLLGDERRIRTLARANPSGKRAAEANLAALREARWRGIGRP